MWVGAAKISGIEGFIPANEKKNEIKNVNPSIVYISIYIYVYIKMQAYLHKNVARHLF